MSRVGISPTRETDGTYAPSSLGVGILLNVPRLDDAGIHRLQVFRASLMSILNGANAPVDVYVFAQSPSPQVHALLGGLQSEGWIDYCFLYAEPIPMEEALTILIDAMLSDYLLLCAATSTFQHRWLDVVTTYFAQARDQALMFVDSDSPKLSLHSRPQFDSHSLWLINRSDVLDQGDRTRLRWKAVYGREGIDTMLQTYVKAALPLDGYAITDAPKSMLERVYDGLFWFLTDARKTWLEIP